MADMSGSAIGSRLRGQLGTAAGKGFFICSLLLLLIGLLISANDFRVSFEEIGLELMANVHDEFGDVISGALSVAPQIVQILWGYAVVMDGGFKKGGMARHPVLLTIFILSFVIDMYFDSKWLSRNSNFDFQQALAISFVVNFILSEVLVSFFGSIVIATITNRSGASRSMGAAGAARAGAASRAGAMAPGPRTAPRGATAPRME